MGKLIPNPNNKDYAIDDTTGKIYKLNRKTGQVAEVRAYDASQDPLIGNVRAAVESALPITRPIAAVAAQTTGSPTLQALNPYQGKDAAAAGLSALADITGQGAQVITPVKGLAANVLKFGIPAVLGVASKLGGEALAQNEGFNNWLNSDQGKLVMDYILPAGSTALSVVPLTRGIRGALPSRSGPVDQYLKQNPNAVKNMFDEGNLLSGSNVINKTNTLKGLEQAGFESAAGAKKQIGDNLYNSIKSGISKVKDEYRQVFDEVKSVPVKKENIRALISDLQAAKPANTYSAANRALIKDIDDYIGKLRSMKNPTVEKVDALKQAWRDDTLSTKETFQKPYSAGVASEIGNRIGMTAEDALTPELKTAFQQTKGNYATMAEARADLDFTARASAEEIMKRINTGDKLDALARLASPDDINAALKADAHFNSFNKSTGSYDPTKMVSDYLDKLRKIDSVNPELAARIFDASELPIATPKGDRLKLRYGNLPETVSAEVGIATQRGKEREKTDKIRKGLKITGR